jgi:hypothetical protein
MLGIQNGINKINATNPLTPVKAIKSISDLIPNLIVIGAKDHEIVAIIAANIPINTSSMISLKTNGFRD